MPELPEVETIRHRVEVAIAGKTVKSVEIYSPGLRRLSPRDLQERLPGQRVISVDRRGKYLLMRCSSGTVIFHLGISGSLLLRSPVAPPRTNDHFDILMEDETILRFHDTRHFGRVAWTQDDPMHHPLLAQLGPEPLGDGFDGHSLHRMTRGRSIAIKPFLMDSHNVSGIGNMYASEALFLARIAPTRASGRLTEAECRVIVASIRETLQQALTTEEQALSAGAGDEVDPAVAVSFNVYGRSGQPCRRCGTSIKRIRQGERSTFYCEVCQK
ncbi:bifunctional DNA-formamidopyrimidine glycosylase/DNA-(apurinic or apyrimidinic site) lyase [Geobacter sp. DSM 9736]|uniref:bifunctional DNA-formamidopyrimidine glycosylase/DNA-(apurinic or apyrimidinic site) lyase n=1 Tax=Geobacter sp. DSM 9736 TaxID=1277350 RepID=UPI000B51456B|nr:bifunctional DNA-formamidopyrimidine glycosylase/DNA-(apurinic or apyrimidinic site) lyase [Geobacter sp. DSM 9736]SNB48059.1 DNA-(apurinic or apyrimidinic site) lyase [Geobacter sp. DSM 9736]